MANALDNSLTGMLAAERAIATTSHNVANANTDGYSRQRVINTARIADPWGGGYQGAGVQTASIQRIHYHLAEAQLQAATTEFHRVDAMSQMASRVSNLFIEENSGLNNAQVEFFSALEDAANNPHAPASANHVIATANTLVSRFNFIDDQLRSMQSEVNSNIQSNITAINDLSRSIHSVNKEITAAATADPSNPPSDLLDQRDSLLQTLSGYVSLSVLSREGLGVDVSMENGVPLVTVAGPTTLSATPHPSDPEQLQFNIETQNGSRPVADPPGGGSLGGLLEFNREILDSTRNQIGQLAAVLAYDINDAFEEIDPANAGNPLTRAEFFTQSLADPIAKAGNQGTAAVTLTLLDPSVSTTSNYTMTFDGSEYTVTRLSDNTQISGATNLIMDGIQFSASGAAVAGDSFMVKPFVNAARSMAVQNIDAQDLGAMVGTSLQQYIPVSQTMAEVQNKATFNNGAANFGQQYAAIVSAVGSADRTAEIQLQSMASILDDTQIRHDQVSGVSLDEEAANLIKYQQAYEASARVMVVAGTMFDSLLSAIN